MRARSVSELQMLKLAAFGLQSGFEGFDRLAGFNGGGAGDSTPDTRFRG